MPISIMLELFLKPERAGGYLQRMKELLPDTRAFDGCLSVNVFRDADDPSHIVLVEEWQRREDHQRYMAWREETGASADLAGDAVAPPKVTYCNALPEL